MKSLINRRFGLLKVVELSHRNEKRIAYYWCLCDCGNAKQIRSSRLTGGQTTSCGCNAYVKRTIHGKCRSLTYGSWRAMMQRCYNPLASNFRHYGGQGVKVLKRWHTFKNFLADMGERKNKYLTLDRINPKRNYTPKNCRWATAKVQANNKRKSYANN
jgi:hypothetical protein